MKLVIIMGPHAVGKMTDGQELAKITGLKLFHNHMTIDVVSDLFANMPKEQWRLTFLFRREIFEAFAKSDEYGLIFTYMCAFEQASEWEYLNSLEALFAAHGAETYYVELEAGFDVRIERNKTDNRLLHKSTKRDIEKSETLFRRLEAEHRLNSYDGEVQKTHYIKINNTDRAPKDAAREIKTAFGL